MDCQKLGSTVCDANGIEVYPTMVWFKDGERVRNGSEGWVDSWIAIFLYFLTVFQSYQVSGRMIEKGCSH